MSNTSYDDLTPVQRLFAETVLAEVDAFPAPDRGPAARHIRQGRRIARDACAVAVVAFHGVPEVDDAEIRPREFGPADLEAAVRVGGWLPDRSEVDQVAGWLRESLGLVEPDPADVAEVDGDPTEGALVLGSARDVRDLLLWLSAAAHGYAVEVELMDTLGGGIHFRRWCARCGRRRAYDGETCTGCGWPWPGR